MKTLKKLAREAGGVLVFVGNNDHPPEFNMTTSDLARFRAAVLEEAALICDGIERKKWETLRDGGKLEGIGPRDCAAAIRAAKEQA